MHKLDWWLEILCIFGSYYVKTCKIMVTIDTSWYWRVYKIWWKSQVSGQCIRMIFPFQTRIFVLSAQTDICPKERKTFFFFKWRCGSSHASLCMLMPEGVSTYWITKAATMHTHCYLCTVENSFKLHAHYSTLSNLLLQMYGRNLLENWTYLWPDKGHYCKNQQLCMLSLCFN